MILTAHQPCYFPWLGFWHKLASADRFVILDTVQFERRGYSNRVSIKTHQGPQWLTIPVEHGQPLLKDALIADNRWQRKHLRAIELAYRKAPYFLLYMGGIEKILTCRTYRLLTDICDEAMWFVLDALLVYAPVEKASNYNLHGKKSSLVLDMCEQLGATRYIFGARGRDYADVEAFKRAGVEPVFQDYKHPTYPQLHGPFVPGLSILDLLFNCGPSSLGILMNG